MAIAPTSSLQRASTKWIVMALAALAFEAASSGQEVAPGLPEPVTADDFAPLKTSSPFLRSLDLSQSPPAFLQRRLPIFECP
jgi:hypothetical protein